MMVHRGGMDTAPHAFDQPAHALRSAARTNLYFAAHLVGLGSREAVTVRNLSATGALVRAHGSLENLGPVCLVRGDLRADGTLAWLDGQNGGISFFEPIRLDQWAPGVAYDVTGEVERLAGRDAAASSTRRNARDPAQPDRRDELIGSIAEELAFASRRLEAVARELADDAVIGLRHAARLQHIAATARVLGHLNHLLASDAPEDALAAIGMDDLRRRLERAPPL